MKLTLVTGEYPPMQGGIADYTAQLAHHLQAQKVEPTIFISQKYQQFNSVVSEDEPLPVRPAIKAWNWRLWGQMKKFLRHQPTDILHIQYQAAAFELRGWLNWLPWYLRRGRFPKDVRRPIMITTFHDLRVPYLFPKAGDNLRWRSILSLARYSDAVICTNAEDAALLRAQPWGGHVHEIPLGNNVSINPPHNYHRQQWRGWLGLDPSKFVLAYFGFLNESKGGEDLIQVLDQLVKRGLNVHLLMIGGEVGDSDPNNVAYAQHIRHLIAAKNLQNHITFTGFVGKSAISGHLLAADAALMPYRDGVSFRRTTLVAALRHSLPIISTPPKIDLPQIRPNENMLLAPARHVMGLTACVMRVAEDEGLRQQLRRGACRLGETFDWSQIAKRTKRLYQDLIKANQ